MPRKQPQSPGTRLAADRGVKAVVRASLLSALLLSLVAGCSRKGDDRAHGGNAVTKNEPTGAEKVISADSDAIEVHRFSFWEGGYRWTRRLDRLSTKQLELAKAIAVVPPTGECWEDAAEMSVVVSAGASQHRFSANEFRGTCGRGATLVDFERVKALVDTVHCLSAKGYDGKSPEKAASLVPGEGCWHGLFNGGGATPEWWFKMEVAAAGEYQILLDGCADRELRLDLLESDATTELASATEQGECPALTHTFEAPGSYALRVDMLSGTSAGDFFLSVEPTAP
jgi:hypothetical protein